MGNIQKRPNGKWRARFRDNAGREHSRHFDRKQDGQAWLDSVTTARQTGTYADPSAGRITFEAWSKRWMATKVDLKPTTRRTYKGLLDQHILPAWRSVKLVDISHEAIAAWVAKLSTSGLSASTIRQIVRVMSLVLALAVRDGRLARNPAGGVPLPRARRKAPVFLTHAQVDSLADAAGVYALAIHFLAYTGVRYGEMAALRVGSLDLMRRRAHIHEAVADVNGHAVFGAPKTHQERSVPIPRFLADELIAHVAGKAATDFVFAAPKGGVYHLRNFRRNVFDPAVKATGLSGLTPHGLRHTAASLAIAAGADVKVIQQMLGHKSATMTLDLYGHLFSDQLDTVAEAMDAARTAADRLRTGAKIVNLRAGHQTA